MSKTLTTIASITLLFTILFMIKFYLYFDPRYIEFYVPTEDATLYAETWTGYTKRENIRCNLPHDSIAIAHSIDFYTDEPGFYKILLPNGAQYYIDPMEVDFQLSNALYQNTISWYMAYHLEPRNLK